MENKNILKNYFYNMIYQVMNILIPILTIPYISRVLGAEMIGKNSYTQSIVFIFSAICMFGITNYGSKNIAFKRRDKKVLTKTFWDIWILQLITSSIGICIYCILFIVLDILEMKVLFIMQLPWLLATLLDISWFYVGIEDFKKTVTRNTLVKLIGMILIFILVKNKESLWIFILINSMSAFLGNIIFWIYIPNYICKVRIKSINLSKNIKGAFILLIPQLAIQVYTILDRFVIGKLSDMTQLGYYDQSQKIARVMLAIVTSLSIVLMPRIANMYAQNDNENINKYLKRSLDFTIAISIFMTTSIIAISKHFVPVFFGEQYEVIIPYMMLSSLIIIFISIGGVFSNQFALPTGKNKEYIIPLFLAAIINVVANMILVPKLGAFGGVVSIIFTELCVVILRIFLVRKYLDLKNLFKGTKVYLFAGITSFFMTCTVSQYLNPNLISIIIESIVSFFVFAIFLLRFDNQISIFLVKLFKKNKLEKG